MSNLNTTFSATGRPFRDNLRRPDSYGLNPEYIADHETRKITVGDGIWGVEEFPYSEGDGIWYKLFHHPVVLRLFDVEQLTLPPEFSIIPGSGDFPRAEHVWGSTVLTRKLIAKWENDNNQVLDDRKRLTLQLRAFVSDLGHTAGSHLGDWMFQGFGGGENAHDLELKRFLKDTGIANIIEQASISLDEVVFPEVEDFVERSSPDLCIDRLDYSVRQLAGRFFSEGYFGTDTKELLELGVFSLNEDMSQIIVNDLEVARKLAVGFSLLTTEHFSNPVHNTILRLYAELFRTAIVSQDNVGYIGELGLNGGIKVHPRELMYMSDGQILRAKTQGYLEGVISETIRAMADPQRRSFSQRIGHLERSINEGTLNNYPLPHQHIDGAPNRGASACLFLSLEPTDVQNPGNTRVSDIIKGEPFTILPLKARSIDPWVSVGGDTVRLSEANKEFRTLISGVGAVAYQGVLGITNLAQQNRIIEYLSNASEGWSEAMERNRRPYILMDIINQAAQQALANTVSYGSRGVVVDLESVGATYLQK